MNNDILFTLFIAAQVIYNTSMFLTQRRIDKKTCALESKTNKVIVMIHLYDRQ